MAFKVIISKEYKEHPAGYKVKRVRLGSFFFGEIREYKAKIDGRPVRIYWSARLAGEQNSSEKAWAFDKSVMNKMSSEGACLSHVGVMITSDSKRKISDPALVSAMWLTTAKRMREFGNNSCLPFDHFKVVEREVSDDVKLKMMKVGGR